MTRPFAYCDTETYKNYWLCKFLLPDDKFVEFTILPEQPILNKLGLLGILMQYTIVTFNGNGYDGPMIALALSGANNQQLKDASDRIVTRGLKPWEFRDQYRVQLPKFADMIDIMDVLPGVRISLKKYGAIMHAPTVQDLPIKPDATIDMFDRVRLSLYCGNDLKLTRQAHQVAIKKGWMALRERISADIGVDCRSKSDPQIAEAITKFKLGFKPQPRQRPSGYKFTYQVPACIAFQTEQLRQVLQTVRTSPFTILDKDAETGEVDEFGRKIKSGVRMHPDIEKIRVRMGSSVYKFGAGGLHSQEECISHYATDDLDLVDSDVGSFYPSIIIALGLYPEQCGPQQLVIYRDTKSARMQAKRDGETWEAELATCLDPMRKALLEAELIDLKAKTGGYKTLLNGWFGKLGSKYSMAYAPELLMQVTITGQLMLLMLIEALELNGISVVSANTDGIVTRATPERRAARDAVTKWWETATGMELEHAKYKSIHFQSVNNYVAFTDKNKAKRKGVFVQAEIGSSPSGSKTPDREICADAVVEYLQNGTPVEQTVYRCHDVRKFILARDVKGGGIQRWQDAYQFDRAAYEGAEQADCMGADCDISLGKVVRGVKRRDYTGAIHYETNGNMVANSTGVWPLMTLPDAMPEWVDYGYYVAHARELLASMGVKL